MYLTMTNNHKGPAGNLPYTTGNTGGKMIGLYDKDAVCIAEEAAGANHTGALQKKYISVWHPVAGGNPFATLVTARVSSGKRLQAAGMAAQHIVLASGQGKGIALKQNADGSLNVYCMIPGLFNGQSGCNIDFSSDGSVRQYLRVAFAGWHHVYHEVLAMANGFSLVSLPLNDILAV